MPERIYASPIKEPFIVSWKDFVQYVKEDWTVNDRDWKRPGMQAMFVYRLGIWRYSIRRRVFRAPLSILCRFFQVLVRNLYGIEIAETSLIGRRLRVAHQHGITVHPQAVIGDDCLIRHGVSIGRAANHGSGAQCAAPVLGDRVEIGANSVVVGGISIGDDVVIGPCVAVMRSIRAGSIVVAHPPRIMAQPPRPAAEEEA